MTVEMLETKEQDMVDIATKDIAKCHEKITQISAEVSVIKCLCHSFKISKT